MTAPWLIRVYDDKQLVCIKDCVGPLELGRQDASRQEQLYEYSSVKTGGYRLVIAVNEEVTVSRQHARVEAVDETHVRISNLSAKVNFTAGHNRPGKTRELKPGQSSIVEMPAFIEIGTQVVNLQAISPEESRSMLQCLEAPSLPP